MIVVKQCECTKTHWTDQFNYIKFMMQKYGSINLKKKSQKAGCNASEKALEVFWVSAGHTALDPWRMLFYLAHRVQMEHNCHQMTSDEFHRLLLRLRQQRRLGDILFSP